MCNYKRRRHLHTSCRAVLEEEGSGHRRSVFGKYEVIEATEAMDGRSAGFVCGVRDTQAERLMPQGCGEGGDRWEETSNAAHLAPGERETNP